MTSFLEDLVPLERRGTTIKGEDKELLLEPIRKMLQWGLGMRDSALELAGLGTIGCIINCI